ncbi:hypothetical protein [Microbulbifer taiwanensis]|uniref:Uncharacterized protein n=1 Tax=Microbulbifer taiwanensis TaxID=986746 RepID=A0ABW1YJ19_9GAMM|nr:hypothetical protein [Microbulbifer taiwanensis]
MATYGRKIRRSLSPFLIGLSVCCTATLFAQEGETGASMNGVGDSLALRYTEAELVAQVQITGVHRDVDNALSEPGMIALSGYVYSAVSRHVWKGQANRLVAFRLGLEYCDKKLEKGARYLIFASPDSFGRLQLRSCDAAVAESEADPLLARLREVVNG